MVIQHLLGFHQLLDTKIKIRNLLKLRFKSCATILQMQFLRKELYEDH